MNEEGFEPGLSGQILVKKREPEPQSNLAKKIKLIRNSVGTIKKKGTHTQGWKYLRIEDAVEAVNKLLDEHDLNLTGTLAKKASGDFDSARTNHHDKGYITDLVMEWTLEDIVSGEKRTFSSPGSGFDSTDKGTYKANTGSRKYAIINIFNLPIGDNPEGSGNLESSRDAQKNVAASKIAKAAGEGSKAAIDALSQIEPEKKLKIERPEELNGHFIRVCGLIAVPQLERFFDDTGSKRFKKRTDGSPYWKVSAEYEKGLLTLCERLGIEVEG